MGALVTGVLMALCRPRRAPGSLADLVASAALVTPLALVAAAATGLLGQLGLELETVLPWDQGLVPRYAGAGIATLGAGTLLVWAWRARRAWAREQALALGS